MIKSLNALRFVFALMVFLSHLNYIIPTTNEFWSFCYRYVFREGYVGVSFFFMLSGYILAYRYADEFVSNTFSFKTFVRRRLARIVPMYYVGLLIALPLSFTEFLEGDRVFYFKKLVTNLFLIQSLVPISDYYFSFNGVSWSVATELVFYVSFPVVVTFLIRQRSLKKIVCTITVLLVIIATILLNSPNAYYWLYISPYLRIADFVMGICLFLWLKNKNIKIPKEKATSWEVRALYVFFFFLVVQTYVHENFKVGTFYWVPIATIIGVFSITNVHGRLSAFLSHKLLQHLGHISFSFYLLHHSFFKYYEQYLMHKIPSQWTGFVILFLLLISVFTSSITYNYIEEPARKLLRKRFT